MQWGQLEEILSFFLSFRGKPTDFLSDHIAARYRRLTGVYSQVGWTLADFKNFTNDSVLKRGCNEEIEVMSSMFIKENL